MKPRLRSFSSFLLHTSDFLPLLSPFRPAGAAVGLSARPADGWALKPVWRAQGQLHVPGMFQRMPHDARHGLPGRLLDRCDIGKLLVLIAEIAALEPSVLRRALQACGEVAPVAGVAQWTLI